MDFKDWKITSSDGKKAVLKHRDGHFMSIAMKALSRVQQQQLHRLAGGGMVNKGYDKNSGTSKAGMLVRDGDMEMAKVHAKSTLKNIKSDAGNRKNLAKGGNVDEPETQPVPILGSGRYANGGDVKLDQIEAQKAQNGFNGALGVTPQPTPTPTPAPKPNYDEGTGAVAPVAPPAAPMMLQDNTLDAPAAVGLQQQAANEQQGVDSAKAQAMQGVEQDALNRTQSVGIGGQNDLVLKPYQDLQKHTDDFKNYVEGHDINPTAYTDNAKTNHKTSTVIGLMLGGMAGQGHGNVAMDYINKQIDRDIDAQKTNINNRHTVLGAYQDLYKNSNVAANLARVSTNDIYAHKVAKVAASLGTRQAQATADAFKASKMIENHQLLLDSAGRLGTAQIGAQQAGQGTTPASGSVQQGSPAPTQDEILPGDAAPPVISPLLHAGAENGLKGLAYAPKAKDQLGEITKQYTNAQQADKSLAQLGTVYSRLANETNGLSGRIHRMDPHALEAAGTAAGTAVGAGLGSAVGPAGTIAGGTAGAGIGYKAGSAIGSAAHAFTNTDTNRAYDADRTNLLGMISSALKGTNVGGQQIGEIVDANSPETGDSAKTIHKKLKNIEDFIKNHTETSLLKAWHLTNDAE